MESSIMSFDDNYHPYSILCFPNFYRYVDLEMSEFMLQDVYVAARSQVIMKSSGKAIQIVDMFSKEIMSETLFGDSLRLQQVLADFLMICVNFTPVGGLLGISATSSEDNLGQSVQLVRLEFRYKKHIYLLLMDVVLDRVLFIPKIEYKILGYNLGTILILILGYKRMSCQIFFGIQKIFLNYRSVF